MIRHIRRARAAIALISTLYIGCSSDEQGDSPGGSAGAVGGTSPQEGGAAGTSGASAGQVNGGAGQAGNNGGGTPTGGSVQGGAQPNGGASSGGAGGVQGGGLGGVASGGVVSGGGGAGGSAAGAAFALESPELSEGATFAAKHTCSAAGFDKSVAPELRWTAGPAGTKSYAITFIDVTLVEGMPPSDLGYHWVIWNIPADKLSLPGGFMDAPGIGASQNRAYLGPCPNFGGGSAEHTYEFKLYALASDELSVSPTTGTGAVKDAAMKLDASNLAVATLSGKSNASPP
jgi:phosphatidylethanolamine-binding protein (PEBP) family uncharacterized protein